MRRKRRRTYHRLLRNRSRPDIHLVVGGCTPSIHRPRALVIVDPGDVLCKRERIGSADDSLALRLR